MSEKWHDITAFSDSEKISHLLLLLSLETYYKICARVKTDFYYKTDINAEWDNIERIKDYAKKLDIKDEFLEKNISDCEKVLSEKEKEVKFRKEILES